MLPDCSVPRPRSEPERFLTQAETDAATALDVYLVYQHLLLRMMLAAASISGEHRRLLVYGPVSIAHVPISPELEVR